MKKYLNFKNDLLKNYIYEYLKLILYIFLTMNSLRMAHVEKDVNVLFILTEAL